MEISSLALREAPFKNRIEYSNLALEVRVANVPTFYS
jgi:hypothetical protein